MLERSDGATSILLSPFAASRAAFKFGTENKVLRLDGTSRSI